MKFLLDTNVIIPAEPTSTDDVEATTPVVTELLGLLVQGRHEVFIHPDSVREIEGDRRLERRELRSLLLTKYRTLPSPPVQSETLRQVLGRAVVGSHDEVDHLLLAAVLADAVDYLVTDDRKLHRKAARLGAGERVLGVGDAVAAVRALFESIAQPPPAVERTYCHNLDLNDPIFSSLRSEYGPAEFDEWIRKCRLEHRVAWTIQAATGQYAALCILKRESETGYEIPPPALKICTFKIAENFRGCRYGELLLKPVFEHAAANGIVSIYVTAFDRHEALLTLFETFGFGQLDARTRLGEVILAKRLVCTTTERTALAPLEFHIRFGPPALKSNDAQCFVVPVQPRFHTRLFPETDPQLGLFQGRDAFGNGIRKAYLCNAPTRQIRCGDILFFYHSETAKSVAVVGVVEEVLASTDAAAIARLVGKRTVYSFRDIEGMCSSDVLAVNFRQARVLDPALSLETLLREGVLGGPPQSIVSVREEGLSWLKAQVDPQH